ncbi:hypothetical protein [Armatimonas sp.]|uniref:hypothetical protein n=1 Tax=Armatimonas sp. TaxID=1872638 RepID=UPI003750FA09
MSLPVIHHDQELKVTQERIVRFEIERMHTEVMAYLSRHSTEVLATAAPPAPARRGR